MIERKLACRLINSHPVILSLLSNSENFFWVICVKEAETRPLSVLKVWRQVSECMASFPHFSQLKVGTLCACQSWIVSKIWVLSRKAFQCQGPSWKKKKNVSGRPRWNALTNQKDLLFSQTGTLLFQFFDLSRLWFLGCQDCITDSNLSHLEGRSWWRDEKFLCWRKWKLPSLKNCNWRSTSKGVRCSV